MESVWSEISSARWVADVGIPLMATILAIGAATTGIRRQLAHDKELLRTQRRAEAARNLANVLAEIYEEFNQAADSDDAYVRDNWPRFGDILRAIEKAEVILGRNSSLSETLNGARDFLWAWRSCFQRKSEMIANGIGISDHQSRRAIDDALWREFITRFKISADALTAWDGLLPIPEMDWPIRHVPSPKKRKEEFNLWMSYFANKYQASVEK